MIPDRLRPSKLDRREMAAIEALKSEKSDKEVRTLALTHLQFTN